MLSRYYGGCRDELRARPSKVRAVVTHFIFGYGSHFVSELNSFREPCQFRGVYRETEK